MISIGFLAAARRAGPPAARAAIPSIIAPAIVFFDLRVRKEAFDLEVLASSLASA